MDEMDEKKAAETLTHTVTLMLDAERDFAHRRDDCLQVPSLQDRLDRLCEALPSLYEDMPAYLADALVQSFASRLMRHSQQAFDDGQDEAYTARMLGGYVDSIGLAATYNMPMEGDADAPADD